MLWIKEVELVDSVDELRSSLSTRGISMPNFEVLDARIASALNKIIHTMGAKMITGPAFLILTFNYDKATGIL